MSKATCVLLTPLLLHHHADNLILQILVQNDVFIFWIERVEDSGIIVTFAPLQFKPRDGQEILIGLCLISLFIPPAVDRL